MAERLDLSLDDLIKKSTQRTGGRQRNGNGSKSNSGNVRGSQSRKQRQHEPYRAPESRQPKQRLKQPWEVQQAEDEDEDYADVQYTKPTSKPSLSIFERIGTKNKPAAQSGTLVSIANLNEDITLTDLIDLCSTIGEIKSAEFVMTRNARGKKEAQVRFAKKSDAILCVEKFHGMTLDETPMDIKLAGENGKLNPFNPIPNVPAPVVRGLGAGKSMLFGTALDEDDEEDDTGGHQPSFSITMPGSAPPGVRGGDGGGFRDGPWGAGRGRGDRSRPDSDSRGDRDSRGERRGDRVGRGGKRGEGGGRGGGKKAPVTEEGLDAALDAFMAVKR